MSLRFVSMRTRGLWVRTAVGGDVIVTMFAPAVLFAQDADGTTGLQAELDALTKTVVSALHLSDVQTTHVQPIQANATEKRLAVLNQYKVGTPGNKPSLRDETR